MPVLVNLEQFWTGLDRFVLFLLVVGGGLLILKVAALADGLPCENSAQFGQKWLSYASFSDLERFWTSLSEPIPGA